MRIDGRQLTHETSETIRYMAVQRVREGERPSAVMKSYGLCRTTIYKWLSVVASDGPEGLQRRRHPGAASKLSGAQKLQVRRWMNGKDPRQYGFDFGLWTRQIVSELIAQRFGIEIGVTAVGRLLSELDITPQKPLRRAYERDPEAIRQWKESEYPRIRARAKRHQAAIFFMDEAGVRSDQVLGRSWGIRGETPEVATSGRRQSVNAISAVNAKGGFWYKTYTERMNADKFTRLLKDFMRGRRGRVYVVLDGHPAHRAKCVKRYVDSMEGRLELYFLPGYAPELNPDEFVWNYLKRQGVSKKPLAKGESLRPRVERDLRYIKSKPHLVRAFFRAPSVAYTAD